MDADYFNGSFTDYNLDFNFNKVRHFKSGSYRNNADDKIDYEGFLCPECIEMYGKYMHKCRFLEDGTIRASDNWQHGFEVRDTIKSLIRHVHTIWKVLRGYDSKESLDDALSAVIFNAQSILHELHKGKI